MGDLGPDCDAAAWCRRFASLWPEAAGPVAAPGRPGASASTSGKIGALPYEASMPLHQTAIAPAPCATTAHALQSLAVASMAVGRRVPANAIEVAASPDTEADPLPVAPDAPDSLPCDLPVFIKLPASFAGSADLAPPGATAPPASPPRASAAALAPAYAPAALLGLRVGNFSASGSGAPDPPPVAATRATCPTGAVPANISTNVAAAGAPSGPPTRDTASLACRPSLPASLASPPSSSGGTSRPGAARHPSALPLPAASTLEAAKDGDVERVRAALRDGGSVRETDGVR